MEKIKFDKIDKVLYEARVPSGLQVILAPMPAEQTDAIVGLYISAGGFARTYSIGNQKIAPGTPDLVLQALKAKHDKKADPLFAPEASLSMEVQESYTSISVKVKKEKALDYIEPLLALTDSFSISNDEAEGLKKPYLDELKKAEPTMEMAFRPNLYAASPMKDSYHGSEATVKDVHQVSLRRFFNTFYVPTALTLFVVGSAEPEKVEKAAAAHVFPAAKNEGEVVVKDYKEDYKSVPVPHLEGGKENELLLGVKLPARKDMFESFGEKVFSYYELIRFALFSQQNRCGSACLKDMLSLEEVGLRQGGEEAFIAFRFQSANPEILKAEIEKYFTSKKIISFWDFRKLKKEMLSYYQKMFKADETGYFHMLEEALANSFGAPALIEEAYRASYSRYLHFIEAFVSYPRSYIYKTTRQKQD
jgi:hypothetical protein